MTAREWKERGAVQGAEEAVELLLPSGMTIRARRPGPMQFAAWDRLPLMLAAMGRGDAAPMGVEEAAEIAAFLRRLVVYCCIEPRVAEDPVGDEMPLRDVPEADWTFIVRWALRVKEAGELRSFRGGRKDGRGVRDGETVFLEAERADGDRGSGAGAGVRPGGGEAGN